MKLKLALAAALLAAPTITHADDLWSGHYWGDCGNNVQCSLDIGNGGETVIDVKFIVADRLDANKIKCQLDGKFTRSAILLIEGNVKKAGTVSIGRDKDGLHVFNIPKKACGYKIGGLFQEIGD